MAPTAYARVLVVKLLLEISWDNQKSTVRLG
jgi:hypothetical protein